MVEKENLEEITQKESQKPGFFRKHWKKIALAASALVLTAVTSVAYISFKREGTVIRGNLDRKIDTNYYHSLANEDVIITDISQIEDLVAEVYNLTTGKKIEDEYRFNIFDQGKVPLRIKLAAPMSPKFLKGLNWGNGDIYLKPNLFFYFLKTVFHELGHKNKKSYYELLPHLVNKNETKEPIAEKNVIDSAISLSYIDPELGYLFYSDYIVNHFKANSLFKTRQSKMNSATKLNQVRLIENGHFEIEEKYDSDEVDKIIEEKTSGKNKNELISEMYSGFLEMFRKRFSDKKDFEEKYSKLKDYFKYGITDTLYEKESIPKEEILAKVKAKEDFLQKENHPKMIIKNLTDSLTHDYNILKSSGKD